MRFKITRVYVVEADSKAEALELLRTAADEGRALDYQEVEFIRLLAEANGTTPNAWLETFKAQLR